MKEKILQQFNNLGEIPLFYCESGSRLWGMASPDSDFDVRGCHILSKEQYYSFKKQKDVISKMDGLFDFSSFAIDKMFGLLSRSNPTVFEWVRSEPLYYNCMPEWAMLRSSIIENIDSGVLFYHYLSLAKGHIAMMDEDKKDNYKTVFYIIRGLLSAELASQNILPALDIMELRHQFNKENEVIELLENSMEQKRSRTEKESLSKSDKDKILLILKNHYQSLRELNIVKNHNNDKLDKLLADYSYFVKDNFYSA